MYFSFPLSLTRCYGTHRAYAQRCVCTILPNRWDTGACLINDVQSINLWPIYSESTTTNRATAKCDNNGPRQQQTNKERERDREGVMERTGTTTILRNLAAVFVHLSHSKAKWFLANDGEIVCVSSWTRLD